LPVEALQNLAMLSITKY